MCLKQDVYVDTSFAYESSLDANFRKDNGIYYTDLSLAEKMIDELHLHKNMVIMDPCCGSGAFLYAAKKKNYVNLYGTDLDKRAVNLCSNSIDGVFFRNADSIWISGEKLLSNIGVNKIPDVVIGNPPYVPLANIEQYHCDNGFLHKVLMAGRNLFVASLMRSFEIVKEGGVVSYIIPKNFLHVPSYGLLRKEILRDKTIISITDIGEYFKNVRGEQIVFTVKNEKAIANHKVAIKKLVNNDFVCMSNIPQDFYEDEIMLFNSEEDYLLYKKLSNSYQKLSNLCKGYIGRGRSKNFEAVTGKEIRKFGYKNKVVPSNGNQIFIQNIYSTEAGIIAAFGGNLEASETVTIFTDGDSKKCKYILGVLHSRLCNFYLYKYCYNSSKLTMHTDAKYLGKIPLPSLEMQSKYYKQLLKIVEHLECIEYMNKEWFLSMERLNDIVYEMYGLTNEEIKYIDETMKIVQSKRWNFGQDNK